MQVAAGVSVSFLLRLNVIPLCAETALCLPVHRQPAELGLLPPSVICEQCCYERRCCQFFREYTCALSRVQLLVTPWTVARQAPLSMGFPRHESGSGLPFPALGDLPNQVSCASCIGRWILYHWATWEAHTTCNFTQITSNSQSSEVIQKQNLLKR